MACACRNKNRAKANNFIVKRTPIRHSVTGRSNNCMKRIIRRELK